MEYFLSRDGSVLVSSPGDAGPTNPSNVLSHWAWAGRGEGTPSANGLAEKMGL